MTAPVLLSVPLGIGLGLGLWTLLSLIPRFGAPRLSRRIAPYVADVSPGAREVMRGRPAEPGSVLLGLAAPGLDRGRRAVTAILGGDEVVERRLRQAGQPATVERFRSRQLLWCALGLAVGVAAVLVWTRGTPLPVAAQAGLVILAAAVGLLAPEQLLAMAARRRQARIAAELPTVLDFFSLALSAGEGVLDALRRVARTGSGELAGELARVISDVNAGVALPDALTRCADAIALPAFTRAVDQLVGAIERGTPLADVLRAQAMDVREDAKRRLLEAAGRKEVAMLVPLVMLILPITVLFAIFPGIMVLQLGL